MDWSPYRNCGRSEYLSTIVRFLAVFVARILREQVSRHLSHGHAILLGPILCFGAKLDAALLSGPLDDEIPIFDHRRSHLQLSCVPSSQAAARTPLTRYR